MTLQAARKIQNIPFVLGKETLIDPRTLWGIHFKNPIGLAAGLDKNAECLKFWESLGFGFVEVGTVTPEPQQGNPKPRIFRDVSSQSIINRMGFNSKGVDYVMKQLQSYQGTMPIGVNIGKNKQTPLDKSVDDYAHVLKKVYPYADYICINISSPNTPSLRQLQFGQALYELLAEMKKNQCHLSKQYRKKVPLLVKISPDLDDQDIKSMCQTLLDTQIDGLIATNTTLSREHIDNPCFSQESGGLSGKPLNTKSTDILQKFVEHTQKQLPIIGVGGIDSPEAADKKFKSGAQLIQIYTGLIYHGPMLIKRIFHKLHS